MKNENLAFIVIFVGNIYRVLTVQVGDFYSFSINNGDNELTSGDDDVASVTLSNHNIQFYGNYYDRLYVSSNGLVTFGNNLTSYKLSEYQANSENASIMAPFWADVDLSGSGGNVYYRQDTNVSTTSEVSRQLRKHFLIGGDITWLLIVTWLNVGFYGANGLGSSKTNTFQMALASNNEQTYAIFLYNTLMWTTGTAEGGDSGTGLGGIEAEVGFYNGASGGKYILDVSQTPNVVNMAGSTNVDKAGKWVFEVGGTSIKDPRSVCGNSGTICDTFVPNGRLLNCHPCPYATCKYNCNPGYGHAYLSVMCQTDGQWREPPEKWCKAGLGGASSDLIDHDEKDESLIIVLCVFLSVLIAFTLVICVIVIIRAHRERKLQQLVDKYKARRSRKHGRSANPMPDDPKTVHKNGDIDLFNKYKDNTNWDNFFAITPRGENEV